VQGRVLFKVDQQTDVFQHFTRVLPVLYGHDVVCSFCELRYLLNKIPVLVTHRNKSISPHLNMRI
jgi:hypothetical protein